MQARCGKPSQSELTPCCPGCLAHLAGAAWWQPDGSSGGRVVLLGSAQMFDDEWLGREDNEPLLDFLLGWLLKVGGGRWVSLSTSACCECHMKIWKLCYHCLRAGALVFAH